MTEQQRIEHIIKVDEYMKMTLMIPKEIDVLEFNGLVRKAKGFFKAANITMDANDREESIPRVRGKYSSPFTPEEIKKIIEMHKKKMTNEQIGDLLGRTAKQINHKVYQLRLKGAFK